MLGWFKQRRFREQVKPIYQNIGAINCLLAYHAEDSRLATKILLMEELNTGIARSGSRGQLFSVDETSALLDINKELRRLYDHSDFRSLGNFDTSFMPATGRGEYYETYDY